GSALTKPMDEAIIEYGPGGSRDEYMARVALSLYLTLAAAAGPWWLCCCATARAGDLLASLKPAETDEVPKCCCSEHAKVPPKQAPGPKHVPQAPCQCKDTQPTPFLQTGNDVAEFMQQGKLFSVPLPNAATSIVDRPHGRPTGPDAAEFPIIPHLCGRALLASLHILRC